MSPGAPVASLRPCVCSCDRPSNHEYAVKCNDMDDFRKKHIHTLKSRREKRQKNGSPRISRDAKFAEPNTLLPPTQFFASISTACPFKGLLAGTQQDYVSVYVAVYWRVSFDLGLSYYQKQWMMMARLHAGISKIVILNYVPTVTGKFGQTQVMTPSCDIFAVKRNYPRSSTNELGLVCFVPSSGWM